MRHLPLYARYRRIVVRRRRQGHLQKDPIVHSRFRIGACMAIPAMGASVGAAAIWRERTGQ
jgi:hypothetical protein